MFLLTQESWATDNKLGFNYWKINFKLNQILRTCRENASRSDSLPTPACLPKWSKTGRQTASSLASLKLPAVLTRDWHFWSPGPHWSAILGDNWLRRSPHYPNGYNGYLSDNIDTLMCYHRKTTIYIARFSWNLEGVFWGDPKNDGPKLEQNQVALNTPMYKVALLPQYFSPARDLGLYAIVFMITSGVFPPSFS